MSELTFGSILDLFLEDETPQIDLEGARYSSKTWTCCAKVLRSTKKHQGIRWLASRYSAEEAKTKIKTVMQYEVAPRMGIDLKWVEDEKAFTVPTTTIDSKIFVHGLKASSRQEELAKVRGLDMGGIWNDQSEEMPQAIAEELPFGTRQEGFPHQLILSPNPPNEDHYITDMFPEECLYTIPKAQRIFPHRVYYRLSLYDNPHCPKDKLAELEAAFPPTHGKYKSLILGLRGPNVTGAPVYEHAFVRDFHAKDLIPFDPTTALLEGIHVGQKHPVWLAAQRTYFGGLSVQAAIIGKKLFLEDFLPIVQRYRSEWFEGARSIKTCCDPPPAEHSEKIRFSNIATLREFGFNPVWSKNSNAADVREAIIQSLGGMMKRRHGTKQAFQVSNDPERFKMASMTVVKHSNLVVDSLEGSYVWDDNLVSVANKKVRQPKNDEWVEGPMRCLENIAANFCAMKTTDAEQEEREAKQRLEDAKEPDRGYLGEHGWLAH